jgi:hypothetical protein
MSNPLKVAIDYVDTTQLLSNLNLKMRLLTTGQLLPSKVTELLNIADTYNIIRMQLRKLSQAIEIACPRSSSQLAKSSIVHQTTQLSGCTYSVPAGDGLGDVFQ